MRIASNTVVSLQYVLSNADGDIIDQSADTPFVYLHGHGNIVVGLERALEGRGAGDSFAVEVSPEDGYGERDERLVQVVPREAFGGVDEDDLQPGMRFRAESNDGPRIVVITGVDADSVTVDGNHPLAGQVLSFVVEVREVREATPTELSHGHVHDGDDHHH